MCIRDSIPHMQTRAPDNTRSRRRCRTYHFDRGKLGHFGSYLRSCALGLPASMASARQRGGGETPHLRWLLPGATREHSDIRSEDLTFYKTDEKDAVLIARLTAQLRCYIPEPLDETWGRLRHLGARRERLLAETVGQVQQIRDLLECVWPASVDSAKQPFRSRTWLAGMSVILARTDGDPARLRRLGPARFETAVRREVVARQGKRPCLRIVRLLFAAAADPRGVIIHRPGALERVQLLLDDFRDTQRRLGETEARMVAVLDELQLSELVCSIAGLSALGGATILAETGDLTRFASARAVVKHSGLAPREKSSGTYTGRTKLTGQGRPGLRTAAWRAIWGAQRANPVYAAKFTHLTSRDQNKLNRGQAPAAIAAALLRQLFAVVTTGQKWDAAIAAGGRREVIEPAA